MVLTVIPQLISGQGTLTIEPKADESSSQSIFNQASLSLTDDSGQLFPGNPRTQKTGDLTGLNSNAVGKQSTSDPAQQTSGNPANANKHKSSATDPPPPFLSSIPA